MNQELFLWLNGLGEWLPSAFWVHLTNLGDASIALAVLIGLYRYQEDRGIPILIIALLATVVIQSGKHYFGIERPPATLASHAFNLIGAPISTLSFPSGHTATAFVCAGILSAQYSKPVLTTCLIVIASLVGLSRIMVGVHWPNDVIIGALVGWMLGYYGYKFLRHRFRATITVEFVAFAILLIILMQQFLYRMPYTEFTGVHESKVLYIIFAGVGIVRFLVSSPWLKRRIRL